MATNPFLSTVVRIQDDRGHYVVTSGPYRYVRHPMYAMMFLMWPGIALELGSWWALIPAAVIVIVFVIRTALEDRDAASRTARLCRIRTAHPLSIIAGRVVIFRKEHMSTTTQVQHGMSPQVKRGVTRWIVRETMGVVMLAVMLFLAAGTVNWIAGWAMVIVMAGWVIGNCHRRDSTLPRTTRRTRGAEEGR